MGPITCQKCRGKYAEHFQKCPYCNEPRPAPAEAVQQPAAAAAAPAEPDFLNIPAFGAAPAVEAAQHPNPLPQARAERPAPPVPKLPACPLCGGPPGLRTIRIETRQKKEERIFFRPGTTWLMRTADVPMVCAACSKSIEMRRYAADVVCMLPLIIFFGIGIITDQGIFILCGVLYLLYLFRWTWGLSYLWADAFLYGAVLEGKLAKYIPLGDPGTVRFPSGIWHCLVRLGWIPGSLILFSVVGSLIMGIFAPAATKNSPQQQAQTPAVQPEAVIPESADPRERAKAKSEREIANAKVFLQNAKNIAVPIDLVTMSMKKKDVKRTDMYFYTVYENRDDVPRGTSYQLMTGAQLMDKFSKMSGHDVDFMEIIGPNLPLSKWQAVKIAATMPASGKPDPMIYQSK